VNESPAELRPETLSASGAGMTRLRTKGGASKESLYELTNGYVTASKTPSQRPGTTWKFNFANTGHTTNAGKTKGLVPFKGVMYAFTHDTAFATSGSANFVILVLRHPTSTTATIAQIHFAQPFMGLLYVVAQFTVTSDYPSGFIGHYWLQNPPVWVGLAQHNANDLVQPTVNNGFYYKAVQLINPPAWTPLLQYAIGDIVQPTVYNGLFYIVNSEFGAGTPPARSGSIEPIWSTVVTRNTTEFSTSSAPPVPATPPPAPNPIPPGTSGLGQGGGGRYDNRFGTNPRQN
jgi:hypothetical protein